MDLNIRSNKTKEVLFFAVFLYIFTNFLLALWAFFAISDIVYGSEFFAMMFILLQFVMIGVLIGIFKTFAQYTYTFGNTGIDIHTSKIYSSKELQPDNKQEKKLGQMGTHLLTHSMSLSKQMGDLYFVFAKHKKQNLFINHSDIRQVVIRPSWHEYLLMTRSVFLVGKTGNIRLKYIDKKHIDSIVSYFQNHSIPTQISSKIFLSKPINIK